MYFLFCGEWYAHNETGGMSDYAGGFDTVENAKAHLTAKIAQGIGYEWAHIARVADGDFVQPASLRIYWSYDQSRNPQWQEETEDA